MRRHRLIIGRNSILLDELEQVWCTAGLKLELELRGYELRINDGYLVMDGWMAGLMDRLGVYH